MSALAVVRLILGRKKLNKGHKWAMKADTTFIATCGELEHPPEDTKKGKKRKIMLPHLPED